MQRLVLSLIATSLAVPAAQLSIDLVTDCTGGLGRATLRWQAEGPVEIRVGTPDGPAMTGLEPATGQTQTGYWVRDGMVFVLVEAGGREVARAQASLVCGGSPGVQAALARGAYFPLETGNQWVFRVNSRAATSTYVTWTVARSGSFEDRAYAVIAIGTAERWFREDEQGRVWELLRFSNGRREALWFDPGAGVRRATYTSPLGSFADAMEYRTPPTLDSTERLFVRGLGLVSSSTRLLTGSSGGFVEGYELVWAQVGGNLRFGTPAPALSLGVESTELDVAGKRVTNCVVPCYFVACGLGSPVDPPGTYRPCFQARVEAAGARAGDATEIELTDESGAVLARQTARGSVAYVQLPLYGKPNEPFAPGRYRVTAKRGDEQSATAVVRVR